MHCSQISWKCFLLRCLWEVARGPAYAGNRVYSLLGGGIDFHSQDFSFEVLKGELNV